jgi:L-threonylcarbamoyladenylate synthase
MFSKDQQLGIDQAVQALQKPGGIVVVPTDTTYGVVCRLNDLSAVDRIYQAKGRDRSKPLIILGAELESLISWIEGDVDVAYTLAKQFWPGALTIVARASKHVPREILSGGVTVGIRQPQHRATLAVLSAMPNGCVASTSANPSNQPIPRSFEEVTSLMSEQVDYIMPNCGQAPANNESTIVDISNETPRILRAGAINPELIQAICKG